MAIQLFRNVGPSRWYKGLEVNKLRQTLQGVNWQGSHLDVSGRIMSTLILAHPFPNANHRTSIFLARKYLASVGIEWPHYTLRGRGTQRFIRETTPFFLRSKYLLQLHRHGPLVRAALEAGYTSLRMSEDLEAPIHVDDLNLSRDQISERHLAACRSLIENLCAPGQQELLRSPRTKALRQWVQAVLREP